jgi:DNA-binding MarR family transcriptional regulator
MPGAGSPSSSPRREGTAIAAQATERYLAAWRWRRAVEAELKPLGLTFTQWLVLGATAALIRESKDAVNQNEVAARTELDRMTVSQVMTTLEDLGHVDRGPDMIGRGYRIWITSSGRKTLTRSRARLEVHHRTSLPTERARRDQVPHDTPDREHDHLVTQRGE